MPTVILYTYIVVFFTLLGKNSDIKNNTEYNDGFLPDIILLTLCHYIREPLQPMVPPNPFD